MLSFLKKLLNYEINLKIVPQKKQYKPWSGQSLWDDDITYFEEPTKKRLKDGLQRGKPKKSPAINRKKPNN